MRIRTGLALSLLLACAVTGCAKAENTPDVATAGGQGSASASATTKPEDQSPLRFSQCMRDNGVPEFPDPKVEEGGGFSLNLPEGTDKSKIDAAQPKCKQYMPNGGEPPKLNPQQLEEARKLAQCMREHGLPDFPDPKEDGGIAIEAKPGSGLGPDDPKFKAADEACAQYRGSGPRGGNVHKKSEEG